MAAGDRTPKECPDPSCSLRRQGAAASGRQEGWEIRKPAPPSQDRGQRSRAPDPGRQSIRVSHLSKSRPRFHQSPAGLQELLRQDPQAKPPQLGGAAHPSTPRSRGGPQASGEGRSPPPLPSSPGCPSDHKPLDQTSVCSILQSCERGGRACLHAVCWVTGCNLLQVCSQLPFLPPAFGTEAANTVASSRLGWWSLCRVKSRRVRGEGYGATSI